MKNEFKQIKEIYENKIQALEEKIKLLENEKENSMEHASKKTDSHNDHKEESNFNIEAVLNGKYTSFSRSGEVAPKGFSVAHEGKEEKKACILESLN